MHWRRILGIAFFGELLTLWYEFGLPLLQHRIFPDPHFPNLIAFLQKPPSCIVTFRGNFYSFCAASAAGWMVATVAITMVVTIAVRLIRRDERVNAYLAANPDLNRR